MIKLPKFKVKHFIKLCLELLDFELQKYKKCDLICLSTNRYREAPKLIDLKLIVNFKYQLQILLEQHNTEVKAYDDLDFEILFLDLLKHKKNDLDFLNSKRLIFGRDTKPKEKSLSASLDKINQFIIFKQLKSNSGVFDEINEFIEERKRILNGEDLGEEYWLPIPQVDVLQEYAHCDSQYIIARAGRRAYKTLTAKYLLILNALSPSRFASPRFIFAAPTFAQAKSIFWEHLKKLIPRKFMTKDPHETELYVELITGSRIIVVGLDRYHRAEGAPVDFIVIDEMADITPAAWDESIMPMLADEMHKGRAIVLGIPRPNATYSRLCKEALADKTGKWQIFQWKSEVVMSKETLQTIKDTTDPRTFAEQYEGIEQDLTGIVYYNFSEELHCSEEIQRDPKIPLSFCFDFNVRPGYVLICQQKTIVEKKKKIDIVHAIDEIWIESNSNTHKICDKLLEKYNDYKGVVKVYGDATGGNKSTTAKDCASNWDIVRAKLDGHFHNVHYCYEKSNPPENSRIISVNSLLYSESGIVRFQMNPITCPHLKNDFENVTRDKNNAIDKVSNKMLTHPTDAFGYLVVVEFPGHVNKKSGGDGLAQGKFIDRNGNINGHSSIMNDRF